MCEYLADKPYALPLAERYTWFHKRVLTYSLLLTKVTVLRNNIHQSGLGFTYPLGHMVYDPNAIIGDHTRALHFGSSPESAQTQLNEYGSHRLAVLPAPKVWDPVNPLRLHYRCWHSYGAAVLFCYDCGGYELNIVTNPDFRDDLKLSPKYFSKGFIHSVWHKQKQLPGR
jgi:hypothetical protein